MRWSALFDDLESELDADRRRDLVGVAAELLRAERAAVTLTERMGAHLGRQLVVRVAAGPVLRGTLLDAGPHWLLLREGASQVLVPAAAVAGVAGLGRAAAAPAGQVARRLDLRHALRALARDRAFVRVHTGETHFSGTIDRVGADHLDLATHDRGQWRRAHEVGEVWSVPIGHVRYVRSGG